MRRVVALALSVAAAAGATDGSRFTLGVLRRDGILIPFASFDGRRFERTWPDNVEYLPLPLSLSDVPTKWWGAAGPRAPWTAWMADGSPSRPLTLEKPIQTRVFCTMQIGLRTDYRADGPAADPREPTVVKDALAIGAAGGPLRLDPIVDVPVFSSDAARLVALITESFNTEEKKASRSFSDWKHPYRDADRAAFPIALEAFYRTRQADPRAGSWTANYVEAIRRFPAKGEDADCAVITFAAGWVLEREGKTPIVRLTARVTYCDRANVAFLFPFGRLTLNGDYYWVYQTSNWLGESYDISRISPGEVRGVHSFPGGWCPK